mgnify:CR=1 FL=1
MINALGPHDWSLDRSFKEAVSLDDVLLVPQYSDIESRSEVNINSDLDDNITLHLPVISSPMDTITELTMAKEMSRAGGLGIIHRYNTIEAQAAMVHEAVLDLSLVSPNSTHFFDRPSSSSYWRYRRLSQKSQGFGHIRSRNPLYRCCPRSSRDDEESSQRTKSRIWAYRPHYGWQRGNP